jgi:hypothetical protein
MPLAFGVATLGTGALSTLAWTACVCACVCMFHRSLGSGGAGGSSSIEIASPSPMEVIFEMNLES